MKQRKILIGLLLFHAVTAMAGGIALMTNRTSMPNEYLTLFSDFPSFYFPGVILMAVVGGSALIAGIALWKRVVGAELAAIVSAVIMLMWLIGEIVSIGEIHFLQLVYLITALAVLKLTPASPNKKA